MQTQVDSPLAIAIGSFATFLQFVFDLPAPALFAAFIGSCFGVAFSGSMSYAKAAKCVAGGVIASGLMTSMFIHYFGDYSQRGAAAFVAFILVMFHEDLIDLIKKKIAGYGA